VRESSGPEQIGPTAWITQRTGTRSKAGVTTVEPGGRYVFRSLAIDHLAMGTNFPELSGWLGAWLASRLRTTW
jgi:hypothetical protein